MYKAMAFCLLQENLEINMERFTEEKTEEIYIPPEKRQQIIDDLRLF